MRASRSRGSSTAATASRGERATRISSPGVKNASRPSNQSDRTGTPQAAASNSRPDGQWPSAAISARVTLSVSGDEQKNAGWSEGSRCRT
ncbi:hypothetical protein PSR1_03737 [Anaeromyxobacter sp. PSR-1]|nr:hypothetical protein PSR1_03737 [Anaeromyxobacter sp. PSR-1]